MSISTGGPHIIVFERDQQLAALLASELQIVGYECHSSRTAVEVFDAIAHFPIRLVLINLSQAAASRREFWVALDTQRRGNGIQVITFHCSNLAGYGPRDHDDYSQASMADMEVDGMPGLMKLIDTIRARVQGPESNATTMPRLPRTPETQSTHDNKPSSVARQKLATKMIAHSPKSTTSTPTTRSPHDALGASQPYPAPSPVIQLPEGSQATYSDKIRAVLTSPSWNTSQIEAAVPPVGDTTPIGGTAPQRSDPTSAPGISMLQRLANGQLYSSPGLAELSRLVQGTQLTIEVAGNHAPSGSSPQDRDYQLRAAPIQDLPLQRPVSQSGLGHGAPAGAKPSDGVSHTKETQPRLTQQHAASQPLQPPLASIGVGPGSQSLSPTTPNAIPSALDREIKPATATSREKDKDSSSTEPSHYLEDAETLRYSNRVQDLSYQRGSSETPRYSNPAEVHHNFREHTEPHRRSAQLTQETQNKDIEESMESRNAVILDILQSLPAIATPSGDIEQVIQPQVHNGIATRSLGNVLLDGHLVPQDRLEVAQNVQRMLRGVDLNYQLGDILLMFKLLTPDQLLAATLVGYGLITRAQISALGRIRQELHAIGLEYDLENLVILFRILTPEQLREARSSVLG